MRYADLSGLFAVAQSTIVPINVPCSPVRDFFFKDLAIAYEGSEELEASEEKAAKTRNAALLDIQLRKGHEIPISQANDETPHVKRADVCGSHHDDISDAAGETCEPEASSTA